MSYPELIHSFPAFYMYYVDLVLLVCLCKSKCRNPTHCNMYLCSAKTTRRLDSTPKRSGRSVGRSVGRSIFRTSSQRHRSFFFFIAAISASALDLHFLHLFIRPVNPSAPAQATLSWEISSAVHRWPSPASAKLIFGIARILPLTILTLSRKHGRSKSRITT